MAYTDPGLSSGSEIYTFRIISTASLLLYPLPSSQAAFAVATFFQERQ